MDKKQCKVKVVIRVRPPLKQDVKTCVSASSDSVQIFNHRNVKENIQYQFSAVYGMESTQLQIYTDCVKPLLPKALKGQNVSIFAYGPTGAGKTHTMLGTSTNPGVIPRVINGLFEMIEENKKIEGDEWQYKVTFSFLEIYNEKVQDLLEPSGSDLPIREDAEKNILIPGLARKEIHSFDEFKMAFGPASNNRTVAATKLNEHSSRSHSIVQLTVTKSKPCRTLYGKIYLIDLAGSEDNRRTGNQGIRLKESGAINKSLFSLGEVVDAINSGLPRIPYRNSKLTRLLQDSIGGTCHSLMITNIAPEEKYYYDTYCTLNFATKSKKIVNNTAVRETIGIVKPVPQVRKASPVVRESEAKVKRPRLDCSTDSISSDVGPSLSPLMKRQEQWEETVNKRLQELESNLITQMKTIHTVLPVDVANGAQTPKTKAIQEMQRQLAASHAQLKELASRHMVSPPPVQPVAPVQPEKQILSDKTNTEKAELPKPTIQKFERPIGGIKRKKVEEFSCSPLFAPPPGRLKKKNFVSTACASNLKESTSGSKENVTKEEKKAAEKPEKALLNSASQQKRNEEFIQILNTSSVKDLQSLQTVGAKRAKLIFEWRETYGSFTMADDLKKIPGFTDKTVQKLLHSNLVTVT
ncbi:kinesin-like protein KIF22 [Mercenaria mercenaria]|uniref:kinesin-like protein KIF22 n=1 Tax=Mercenaria mercenaria TaxID=6596 RepID=UPI00234F92B8|nr:kinesin-like protein KIF22 [Mercenaria mercenaria]